MMFRETVGCILILFSITMYIINNIRLSKDEFFFFNKKNYTILDKDELYQVQQNRSLLRLAGNIGFAICMIYDYNLIPISLYNFLPDFYFKRKSKDLYIDNTIDS